MTRLSVFTGLTSEALLIDSFHGGLRSAFRVEDLKETFCLPEMTSDPMTSPQILEFGLLEQTDVLPFLAAGVEGATGRRI